jgi:ribonuclease-3
MKAMAEASIPALDRLEEALGYRFDRQGPILAALTHRSAAHESGYEEHYERLEFLGDAVLELVTSEWLFRDFPRAPEGDLARIKSHLVSAPVLAELARDLELGESLRLSPSEERGGGRDKESILADSLEAVFGAIYCESGYERTRDVIEPLLVKAYERAPEATPHDVKNRLQERLQAEGRALPEYRVIASFGPDHERIFEVECLIEGRCRGRGRGSSKKEAERRAAGAALEELEAER